MENQPYDEINSNGHNLEEVEQFIRMMHPDGERFEVRYIRDKYAYPKVFEDPKEAGAYIGQIKDATGVYITLNPVVENISGSGAKDEEIVRRRWLLIDCDPERNAGTNATQGELDAALAVRDQVEAYLAENGFPEPVKLMSGNGGHLLFNIDLDPGSDLVARVLKALNHRFKTDLVKVDTTVCNASRITKVAGTLTKKGMSTPERPQRRARLENPDISPELVPTELLEKVAAEVPKKKPPAVGGAASGQVLERGVPLPVIQPIEDQCAFIRHCHENAETLSEPYWFAMMSNLSLCQDGERLAHEWSSPYPNYNPDETRRKYEKAVESNMPHTCEYIYETLGFAGCETCAHRGKITSPIQLGSIQPGQNYFVRDGGIWFVAGDDKPDQMLTNFTARISKNQMLDDGAETQCRYEVTAVVDGKSRVIQVPASKYSEMGWIAEQLGAKAVLKAGYGIKDKVREAIQTLGIDNCVDETIYTHTGWRLIGDRWVYLHADGAIGAEGKVDEIGVELPGTLDRYRLELPKDQNAEREAVRASLGMLELGPDHITFPLVACCYRAALGNVGASVYLVGATGVYKTQLAALCQQHYGAEMIDQFLPGSWSSTANAIEAQGFLAKDSLFVIDDFKPTGSRGQIDALHKDADRVLRAFANGQGRDRCNRDGSLKAAKAPRAMALSTGEDLPRGESIRARCLIVHVEKDAIPDDKLTLCQDAAKTGKYAQAMGGFLRWVAGQYDLVQEQLERDQHKLRKQLTSDGHKRTPDIMAKMLAGFDLFIRYAVDIQALNQDKAEQLRKRCLDALTGLGEQQLEEQLEFNPANRFCELLPSAISSGHAYIGGENNGRPTNEQALGWEWSNGTFRSKGVCVGWLINDELYINLEASMKVINQVALDNEGIGLTAKTMSKRLYEAGKLVRSDIDVKNRNTHKVRVRINGRYPNVLHMKTEILDLDEEGARQLATANGVAGRILPYG